MCVSSTSVHVGNMSNLESRDALASQREMSKAATPGVVAAAPSGSKGVMLTSQAFCLWQDFTHVRLRCYLKFVAVAACMHASCQLVHHLCIALLHNCCACNRASDVVLAASWCPVVQEVVWWFLHVD